MRKRLPYVDQLKGIAIFLVVLGHLIQNDTVESTAHCLFAWIYAFHMPLFMFISGYISFKTVHINSGREFLGFVQKKAIVLLIPYFAWSLLVNKYFFTNKSDFDILDGAMTMVRTGGGLWFLWFLFFILLCYSGFYLLSKQFNKRNRMGIDILLFICLIGVLILMKPLHLLVSTDSFLMYLSFFFIGIFVSKYAVLSSLLLNKWVFSLCLIVFILLSGRYEFGSPSILNLVIKIVVSVCAISSLYFITQNIGWNPVVDKSVQTWGRGSLVIYATHFLIYRVTTGVPLLSDLSLISLIVLLGIYSIIIILACLFIQKLVELCPPLNLILYGQKFQFSGKYSAFIRTGTRRMQPEIQKETV